MKLYEGYMPKGADQACFSHRPRLVYVTDNGAAQRLEHHVRHSPSGFSWGYSGSGPAELAMCILWDHLGYEPSAALYQKFKEDYVARWSHDDWVLSSHAIEDWLTLHKDVPRRVSYSVT